MNLLIGLVSSNQWLCEKFNKEQGSILPKGNRFDSVNFTIKVFNPKKIREGLHERIRKNINYFDAIVLLTSWDHKDDVYLLRNSLFISTFRYSEKENNSKHYFSPIIKKLVSNFLSFDELVKDTDKENISILPIRNFYSNDLASLTELFQEKNMDDNFVINLGKTLKKLSKRKQPRRESSSKKKYIVDDKKRYFEFGDDEDHGNFATGGKHLPSCQISGTFRFGKKIKKGHFHICLEKNALIWGKFPNCHDKLINISRGKSKKEKIDHLNIFTNDHIRGEEEEVIKQKPK